MTDAPGDEPGASEQASEPSLRSVGRSAAILTGGAFAIQAIGILRELFIAAQVGLSRDVDGEVRVVDGAEPAGLAAAGIVTRFAVSAMDPGASGASAHRPPAGSGVGPMTPIRPVSVTLVTTDRENNSARSGYYLDMVRSY